MRYFVLLTLICFAQPTHAAAVNYVDATPNTNGGNGNTLLLVSGTPTLITLGGNVSTVSDLDDDKWNYRTVTLGSGPGQISSGAVNGGAVFEQDINDRHVGGGVGGGENPDVLVTTLFGLSPGTYQFYVFFWGDMVGNGNGNVPTNSNWDIAARVGDTGVYSLFKQHSQRVPDALGSFSGYTVGSQIANPVPHSAPDPFFSDSLESSRADSNLRLFSGNLGQFTVGNSGSISVYIEGPNMDVNNNRARTWYDGIGYTAVPEPATGVLAMGAIAIMSLLAFQRRIAA